jgi:hypothetical protein
MNESTRLYKLAESYYKGTENSENKERIIDCGSACQYYRESYKILKNENEKNTKILIDEIKSLRSENKFLNSTNENYTEMFTEIDASFLKFKKKSSGPNVDWGANNNYNHLNSINWGYDK